MSNGPDLRAVVEHERKIAAEHIKKSMKRVQDMPEERAAVIEFEVPWLAYKGLYERPTEFGNENFYSDQFTIGDFQWRMLFTSRNTPLHFSVFLENCAVRTQNTGRPVCICWFRFDLFDRNGQIPTTNQDEFTFTYGGDIDRGFLKFCSMEDFQKLLVRSTIDPELMVAIFRVSVREEPPASSTEDVGYTGLRNQGATCYLNSLLQTLFHLPAFRSATYRLPGSYEDNVDPVNNIPLHLAKLFHRLQNRDEPARTTELTQSFGWQKNAAFEQHDIQELARILIENLESKMKGTNDEKTIQHIFKGKTRQSTKCKNIDYESSVRQDFYDIQLQVKGFKNLEESLQHELKIQELVDDNKYHVKDDERGLDSFEEATIGVEFWVLPPVLMMHLARFEYDLTTDSNRKINDPFEFPTELDMAKYLRTRTGERPGPSGHYPIVSSVDDEAWDEALAGAEDQTYLLHSVLVHSGSVHGGHYFAYINPKDRKQWYRFDDASVRRVTEASAVKDSYGGQDPTRFWLDLSHRHTSAYMLVYVRRDRWEEVCNQDCVIPDKLRQEFEEEDKIEAQRIQEQRDAHMYQHFIVYTEEDIHAHMSSTSWQLDLLNSRLHKYPPVRIQKDRTWDEVLLRLSDVLYERSDGSKRVDPANIAVFSTTFSDTPGPKRHGEIARLKGLLNVVPNPPLLKGVAKPISIFVCEAPASPVLQNPIFLKRVQLADSGQSYELHYDGIMWPAHPAQTLQSQLAERYSDPRVQTITEDAQMSRLPPVVTGPTIVIVGPPPTPAPQVPSVPPEEEKLEAAEELLGAFGVGRYNVLTNLKHLERQINEMVPEEDKAKYHDAIRVLSAYNVTLKVPNWEYWCKSLRNRKLVRFYEKPLGLDQTKKMSQPIEMLCNVSWTHRDAVNALAPLVNHPPHKIRLWSFAYGSRRWYSEYDVTDPEPLSAVLASTAPMELSYELLSYSLKDTVGKQELTLSYYSPKLKPLATVTLLLHRDCTVRQVLEQFRAELDKILTGDSKVPPTTRLHLLQIQNYRIVHLYNDNEKLQSNVDFLRVDAEPPKRQQDGKEFADQILVRTAHVQVLQCAQWKPSNQFHGTPFLMYLAPGDTVDEVIAAIRARLGLRSEQTKDWRLVSLLGENQSHTFQETMNVYEYFKQDLMRMKGRIPSMGIDHKEQYRAEQKAIKIHN